MLPPQTYFPYPNSIWKDPLGEADKKYFTPSSSELRLDILIGAKSVRPLESLKLTLTLPPSPWILLVSYGIVITSLLLNYTASSHLTIDIYNFKCLHWYFFERWHFQSCERSGNFTQQTFCLLKWNIAVLPLWEKEKGKSKGRHWGDRWKTYF